jgi:hypothetical protein
VSPEEYRLFAPIAGVAYIAPLFLLRRRPDLGLWYLLLVLPVCMVTAIDLADHRFQTSIMRYTQLAGPGLYVLIAAAFAEARPCYRHWLSAVICLTCSVTVSGAYSSDSETQFLSDAVAADAQSGVPIVFASADHPDWYAGALYLMVSHYTDVRGPIMLLTRPAPLNWDQPLSSGPMQSPTTRLWLVAGSKTDRPDTLLPGITFEDRPETHAYFRMLQADLWKVDQTQTPPAP